MAVRATARGGGEGGGKGGLAIAPREVMRLARGWSACARLSHLPAPGSGSRGAIKYEAPPPRRGLIHGRPPLHPSPTVVMGGGQGMREARPRLPRAIAHIVHGAQRQGIDDFRARDCTRAPVATRTS